MKIEDLVKGNHYNAIGQSPKLVYIGPTSPFETAEYQFKDGHSSLIMTKGEVETLVTEAETTETTVEEKPIEKCIAEMKAKYPELDIAYSKWLEIAVISTK